MRIVHIAQTHHNLARGHKPTTAEFNTVVQSQFAVAQLILENPHCPVLCEGMSYNITFRESRHGKSIVIGPYTITFKKIQKIFPEGFPNNLNDLNRAQQEALYVAGAPIVLLFLNKIPVLYSSTNEVAGKIARDFIADREKLARETKLEPNQLISTMQSIRDEAAIELTRLAAEAHYKSVEETSIVILVYGALHNFRPLCSRNGLHHQVIYTHPRHIVRYSKNQRYESSYIPGTPYWKPSDICDVSKLDSNKIYKQGWMEFSPQKIKLLASLSLIAVGSGLLAMYFLLPVANPVVLLIFGILAIGIGLLIGLDLFTDYLKERYNPPPATMGVVLAGEKPIASQPTLGWATLFSSVGRLIGGNRLDPVSPSTASP